MEHQVADCQKLIDLALKLDRHPQMQTLINLALDLMSNLMGQ